MPSRKDRRIITKINYSTPFRCPIVSDRHGSRLSLKSLCKQIVGRPGFVVLTGGPPGEF